MTLLAQVQFLKTSRTRFLEASDYDTEGLIYQGIKRNPDIDYLDRYKYIKAAENKLLNANKRRILSIAAELVTKELSDAGITE